MNSNLKPKVDQHELALDLEGLEQLLEVGLAGPEAPLELAPAVSPAVADQVTAAPVAAVDAEPESAQGEVQVVLRLLEKLSTVTELVKETRGRLESANERLSSLSTMVVLQTRQLELLNHYQNEAAKVSHLERQISELLDENRELKQVWWRRILAWFRNKG